MPINDNGSYIFSEDDWPQTLEYKEKFHYFINELEKGEGLHQISTEYWVKKVALRSDGLKGLDAGFSNYLLYLSNYVGIFNVDISLLKNSHKLFFESPIKTGLPLNSYLSNVWSVVLKLRILADIGIIAWLQAPHSASLSKSAKKIDQLGDFIKKDDLMDRLCLTDKAISCLDVVNRAANSIKHPLIYNDFAFCGVPSIVFPYKGGKAKVPQPTSPYPCIIQPIADLIKGVDRFMGELTKKF